MARLGSVDDSVSLADSATDVARRSVRPAVILVAEMFMIFIIGLYVAKMTVLVMGMSADVGDRGLTLLTFLIEIAMLFITIDSLASVSSRNPKAWRKVERAAFLLVIFNLLYSMGISGGTAVSFVSINPLIVTPLALAVAAILFWRPVREFYTPVMEDDLPLRRWVGYVLFWPLYPSDEYRILYDDMD